MNSNGSKFSEEVAEFIKNLASQEILNIRYTDVDGEEHELGIRRTREFGAYMLLMNMALASKTPPPTPPKSGVNC